MRMKLVAPGVPSGRPATTMTRCRGMGQPYGLVKLTPDVVNMLEEYGPRTLSATFGDRRPPPESNFVALPNQPIAAYGLVLYEQLANPVWQEAEAALGVSLTPTVAIAHGQPWLELGRPLVCLLATRWRLSDRG